MNRDKNRRRNKNKIKINRVARSAVIFSTKDVNRCIAEEKSLSTTSNSISGFFFQADKTHNLFYPMTIRWGEQSPSIQTELISGGQKGAKSNHIFLAIIKMNFSLV